MCGACSGLVAECLVGGVPKLDAPIAHWLSADEAWNAAAAYAEKMRIGYVRYEKLRKLSAGRFAELYELNLKGKGLFDDLVDKI